MQMPLKPVHSADFKWPFPRLYSASVVLFVYFDKSSEATGYASLYVICQQEMNGYLEL